MDRRLGEIIPFFCFFLESTNKIQTIRNEMKRKRDFTYEVPLLMTKERGGRESRDRYDGDVTDGIVGTGVREGERAIKKERKRGVLYVILCSRHTTDCVV